MITSWSYGVNSLPQFRYGTLYLREEPWWLALCGWAIDILGYGCHLFHWIKFPRLIKVKDEDGDIVSLRDQWGDLGVVYHIKVFDPLFQWHYSHPKSKEYRIEVGYDKARELFVERDVKFFTEQEKDIDNESVSCKD